MRSTGWTTRLYERGSGETYVGVVSLMEQEGLHGVRRALGYSKKDLLLFRKLHVMGLDRQLRDGTGNPGLVADCEYLIERGFMTEAPDEVLALSNYGIEHTPDHYRQAFQGLLDDDNPISLKAATYAYFVSVTRHPSVELGARLPAGAELVVAYVLREAGGRCVPVIPAGWSAASVGRVLALPRRILEPDPDQGVVEVVLRALPVPGDDVPLDYIMDFTQDAETQRRLERLDLWMRRAAQSGRELQDIGLELEERVHEFDAHMRLAEMQHETSGLRLLLTVPLGVIEELAHLKPKGALDVVFNFRDRKASRLEAELKAPGGALAYLYEAERRFNR